MMAVMTSVQSHNSCSISSNRTLTLATTAFSAFKQAEPYRESDSSSQRTKGNLA